MATLFQRLFSAVFYLFKYKWLLLLAIIASMFIALSIGKIYQNWDDDPDRGAIAIENGAFGESFPTPVYLDQGWSESQSLWFYNTTQGSGLMPYDLFLVLEEEASEELLRSDNNMDGFRYLPQKSTFLNPDGLPVGFAKETYKGDAEKSTDYVGYTCAACHTNQVNYTDESGKTTAMRIDGGPAMADMDGFLTALEKSMTATLNNADKRQRFIENVIALDNDFNQSEQVVESLTDWTRTIRLYNTVNHSHIDYGYARLDAFGRIYNRVLQHIINKDQLASAMRLATATGTPGGRRVLTDIEIENVLTAVGENIITDQQFGKVLDRLLSNEPGYPGLSQRELLRVRNEVFNEADAPVSYPFLWDIAQSDYVQWNGLAHNNGAGPLGRNTGEVIGVFGILDWTSYEPKFPSLSALLTGEKNKNEVISFKSSIDLINLQRLESQIKTLKSPVWPEQILGKIDQEKADRGQLTYARYCQSCHEVIDRDNWDRLVVAEMSDIDFIGTDRASAENGVQDTGKSGNLKHTVQSVTGVGNLIIKEDAPVVQILTSATKGVIATPDPDKPFIRRWLDRLYVLGLSFTENSIPNTIKNGNYKPDTMANPYDSLLAYKGRSLNGIWATAPYLHNGSVPTLYDLLLPKECVYDQEKEQYFPDSCENYPEAEEYRPDVFWVGSREFDPVKVGFRSEGYEGKKFTTFRVGDMNTGHEYGAGRTPQKDGTQLPPLAEHQRLELIEYIKTL